jgi:hypothetical protein
MVIGRETIASRALRGSDREGKVGGPIHNSRRGIQPDLDVSIDLQSLPWDDIALVKVIMKDMRVQSEVAREPALEKVSLFVENAFLEVRGGTEGGRSHDRASEQGLFLRSEGVV